jgi:hypothetical protein
MMYADMFQIVLFNNKVLQFPLTSWSFTPLAPTSSTTKLQRATAANIAAAKA